MYRGFGAIVDVYKRRDFSTNWKEVEAGSLGLRELFDYHGHIRLVKNVTKPLGYYWCFASSEASYEKLYGNASLSRLRFERCSRILFSTILPR